VAQSITIDLPEPPSFNEMLGLAMKRTRRTRHGGWMKKAIPGVVYDQAHEAYELACTAAARSARVTPPATPWKRWAVTSAHFRLHNLRDLPELLGGLKWPVDWLVQAGFAVDDSPRELVQVPIPTQEIARANRGVTLTICEVAA
jgi:hypothetical protein